MCSFGWHGPISVNAFPRARLAAQTAYSDATAKRAFPSPASLGFKIDAMDLSRLRDSARPGPSDERAAVIAVHLRNSIRAAAVQVPKRRPPRFGPNYRPAPALRVLSGGACATTQGQVHRGDAVIEARNTRPQSARAEQPSQYRRSELEQSTANKIRWHQQLDTILGADRGCI